ncbi:sporulation histidine kinase inhibitor Sda [Lentibacillus sp. N15]|uniref:sporulation histidine kinase inhibitor Sda n=1 Tax=Lentibacillus songyuanensis TaxID=3136161 RepID=UPI0031BAD524
MESLKGMSNDLLVEAFIKAMELNLDQDFCTLIEQEITDRGLMIPYQNSSQA